MGRVARIRALPAMPPNVRWLVELGRELTVRPYRARPIRTRDGSASASPWLTSWRGRIRWS